jgi:VWFA-related protein
MPLSRRQLIHHSILGALARANGQDPTFSSEVNLVTLLATVRDRAGKFAKGLTKEDFVLREDGRPQTVLHFSQESNLPLKIGILVDTSRSQIPVLEPERKASYAFLNQILSKDDAAFVMSFDVRVKLLHDFTSSREALAAAFDRLAIPRRPATLLFDAVKQASEQQMKPETGRKAFILLSDGGDVRSKTSIGTAIEYAQRADTLLYAVMFMAHAQPLNPAVIIEQALYASRGRTIMNRLAVETGGRYFEASKSRSIDEIYREIEDELRNQYSLAYRSDRVDGDKEYRSISLTTADRTLTVRTRPGYYPR